VCGLSPGGPVELNKRQRPRHLRRMRAWVWGLPTALMATGTTVRPILTYVRSGLYLLTTSVRRARGVRTPMDRKGHQSTQRPALLNLLRWAGMDTWRARLLDYAEVATPASQEASLLLVELPTVRRVLDLVGETQSACASLCRGGVQRAHHAFSRGACAAA
jgi:hypothetical protein